MKLFYDLSESREFNMASFKTENPVDKILDRIEIITVIALFSVSGCIMGLVIIIERLNRK